MSEHMTEAEIVEIERRCRKATAGPWKWEPTEAQRNDNAWGELGETLNSPSGQKLLFAFGYDACWVTVARKNADFIANARTTIPRLLSELKLFRSELKLLRSEVRLLSMENARLKKEQGVGDDG